MHRFFRNTAVLLGLLFVVILLWILGNPDSLIQAVEAEGIPFENFIVWSICLASIIGGTCLLQQEFDSMFVEGTVWAIWALPIAYGLAILFGLQFPYEMGSGGLQTIAIAAFGANSYWLLAHSKKTTVQ